MADLPFRQGLGWPQFVPLYRNTSSSFNLPRLCALDQYAICLSKSIGHKETSRHANNQSHTNKQKANKQTNNKRTNEQNTQTKHTKKQNTQMNQQTKTNTQSNKTRSTLTGACTHRKGTPRASARPPPAPSSPAGHDGDRSEQNAHLVARQRYQTVHTSDRSYPYSGHFVLRRKQIPGLHDLPAYIISCRVRAE